MPEQGHGAYAIPFVDRIFRAGEFPTRDGERRFLKEIMAAVWSGAKERSLAKSASERDDDWQSECHQRV